MSSPIHPHLPAPAALRTLDLRAHLVVGRPRRAAARRAEACAARDHGAERRFRPAQVALDRGRVIRRARCGASSANTEAGGRG